MRVDDRRSNQALLYRLRYGRWITAPCIIHIDTEITGVV